MLSPLFLEHVIFVLSQTPIIKGDSRKGENSGHLVDGQIENDILQAAIFSLTAFFRSLFQLYSSSLYCIIQLNNLVTFHVNAEVVVKLERKLFNKSMLPFLQNLLSNWVVVMV